jgi:hypothetical protein
LDLCLRRIGVRDSRDQIPMDAEGVWRVYPLSLACGVEPDLRLDNSGLTDLQIELSVAPWLG